MATVKLLVIGGPGENHSRFVGAISEVRVRSSTRTSTSTEGTVPMDFGRLHIDDSLDLQIFGVERDQVSSIVDAISPGIIGAIVIADPADVVDPHYTVEALEELRRRRIDCVVTSINADPDRLQQALNLNGDPVVLVKEISRATAKEALLSLLQTQAERQTGTA